jgi:acyl-CoA hydrolase
MVAVDEQRKPKQIPALNLDTDWKRCRFEAAEHRKQMRLKEEVQQPSCSIFKPTTQC